MGHSSNCSTKETIPLNPHKQQLLLSVLDYWSLNKSINTPHNVNSAVFYYPLPNITDLLVRLQKCNIFSLLDPSVRFPPYQSDNTGGKAQNCFCHQQVVNVTAM